MSAVGEDWPDIEGALQTFLRADAGVAAIVANRVFFSSPMKPFYPMILITRIGGASASGETPLDNTFVQIDCFGRLPEEGAGGKLEATNLLRAVRKALSTIRGRTRLDGFTIGFDARVASVFYSPIRDDNRPRNVITVTISAIYEMA